MEDVNKKYIFGDMSANGQGGGGVLTPCPQLKKNWKKDAECSET